MTIIFDVFKLLFKMFVADFRLTMAVLAGVVIVAILLKGVGIDPVWGGMLLLAICVAVLFETVLREARIRSRK
ncbi:MAG: hypothetical protein GXP05_14950 [Alphaproteobacteria bacterium]|nr:hypothetical protein [Alphaproteobacteria bacterium]